MGCGDSKIQNPPNQMKESKGKGKHAKFAQYQSDRKSPPSGEQDILQNQQKGLTIKKKQSSKPKQNQDKSSVKTNDKQNKMKVRKAKELETKPEHQKFINDIVTKSRDKIVALVPPLQNSPSGFIKPVVQYSPLKKGDILSKQVQSGYNKSQWAKPITQNNPNVGQNVIKNSSYVGINQSMKSPYKMKQIQKKLNSIRNGTYEHQGERYQQQLDCKAMDSNHTIYL